MEKQQLEEQFKNNEHFEKLARIVRYAGLNFSPQILTLLLNKQLINTINKLNEHLISNPNMDLRSLDAFIKEIGSDLNKEK